MTTAQVTTPAATPSAPAAQAPAPEVKPAVALEAPKPTAAEILQKVVDSKKETTEAKAPEPEKTEVKATEEKPKEEIEFSKRFTALAKREKTIIDREKAVKANENAVAEWKKSIENAKINPVELLRTHGWSYTDVTNFMLNDQELTAEQKLQRIEERLDAEKSEKAAREAESLEEASKKQQQEIQEAFEVHKGRIKEFIEANAEQYELVKLNDAHDLVFEVIEQHYLKTQELLKIDDATKVVEDWFENEAREKILKSKKFAPKQEVKEPVVETKTQTSTIQPTLTNRAVPQTTPNNDGWISEEESKRRAAQMLRWN